jgi:hypothetical protein
MMRGKPPGVSNIVEMIENGFSELPVETSQPGIERLFSGKPILVMRRLASAGFPGSGFARRPSL